MLLNSIPPILVHLVTACQVGNDGGFERLFGDDSVHEKESGSWGSPCSGRSKSPCQAPAVFCKNSM
jgi:hypothetical protein